MPGNLYYLEDRRIHYITGYDYVELAVLPIYPGPWLVVAKGTVREVNARCKVEFSLGVHAMFSGLMGFDETSTVVESEHSFMLTVAAKIPSEGGGGSFSIPPHRAVLIVRKDSSFPAAEARVTNIKITAYPLDEIVATVLT